MVKYELSDKHVIRIAVFLTIAILAVPILFWIHHSKKPIEPIAHGTGILQHSCAPWDGAAITLRVQTTEAEYPQIYANIWTDSLPKSFHYDINTNHGGNPDGIGVARFCNKTKECKPPRAARITFKEHEDVVHGKYEIETSDDQEFTGTFEVKWDEGYVELCG